MRIAAQFLAEIIEQGGKLRSGAVSNLGILRLALDLRQARERIAELEDQLKEHERMPARLGTRVNYRA